MKIKALKDFFMRGQRSFSTGEERDVTEEIGNLLLERKLVEKVEKVKEKAAEKQPKQSTK